MGCIGLWDNVCLLGKHSNFIYKYTFSPELIYTGLGVFFT